MKKNKQLIINLITTLVVLAVNIFINFGLSRYIVSSIGKEAYGFISLANNFISYATIFTVALNSMASRFITLDIQRGKIESANKYFSSVLISNIIIVLLLILPSVILIYFLENFVNVSPNILIDVKLLFVFLFLNFFITLVGGVFTVATYCTNKLYLTSIKNMESYLIKGALILILFLLFKPAIFYVGIATLVAGIYVLLFNIKFTKELLPNISVDKNNFSKEKVKTLLASGLWNSITNLGNVLADGLDLLISNLAISTDVMGLVAISKTPGNVLNTVLSSIGNVFQPQIIKYYSQDDIESVVNETKKGMKISGIFGNIPFAYIIVFGIFFCSVWMPDVDNKLLSAITAITFINIFSGGIITPLYNIFTITNEVKKNALLNIISSTISTIIVLILIKTTDLDIYAVVGVSAIIGLIKGFVIVPIFCAKSLNVKANSFFTIILKYIFTTIIMIGVFFILKSLIVIKGWLGVLISIIACGVVGLIINYFFLLSKEDRKFFINMILSKLGLGGNKNE